MTIFSGLKGYRFARKEQLPSGLFLTWLKEKWKADLKISALFIIMAPYFMIAAFGWVLLFFGGLLLSIRSLLPSLDERRIKQLAAAEAARTYVAIRNAINKKDPAI